MIRKRTQTTFLIILAILLAACGATSSIPSTSATVEPAAVPAVNDPPELAAPALMATDTEETAVTERTAVSYPIVDTGQTTCYDVQGAAIACPTADAASYGQDAQYTGMAPSYTDNGDRTITDNITGLMWQQSPDTNGDGSITAADKLTSDAALDGASTLTLGGYSDWRLPTIKELYSLIQFTGQDPSGYNGTSTTDLVPFIDTTYFDFAYGDTSAGERIIDAQFASSTQYVSTTMNGAKTVFGVNFADGRIKGYGLTMPGLGAGEKTFFVLYVRGNSDYGTNTFVDKGDGTISDAATGLTWQQDDGGSSMAWEDALAYCENLELAEADDWRLPNVKELQSLVDYGRSPDTTNSAAIDPIFSATPITNEAGQTDYAAYWSSTTHANMMNGANAAYVNFGRSMGYMQNSWIDVHGAGAQRSDPKTGDPADYPTGHGPQGDAIRILNAVRCVRGGVSQEVFTGGTVTQSTMTNQEPNLPKPDLAAAAAQLGVSQAALQAALGAPPPDLAAAAQQLGISETALVEALGVPAGGRPNP